jgi:hypothetical protein
MINNYLRGELAFRVLGGGVDFRWCVSFLILSFSLLFFLVYRFLCLLLVLWFFPLLDDLLELFLHFLVF